MPEISKQEAIELSKTVWKFVWKNGAVFSSNSERAIRLYAEGARSSFGDDCGRIEEPEPGNEKC